MAVRVVIVGAGATGSELARRLAAHHDVQLVDVSQSALDAFSTLRNDGSEGERAEVTLVCADGTSRLQLERLLDRDRASALVATAGSDEVNSEILTLALSLGYEPVLALQHELTQGGEPTKSRATVLDRPRILADYVERSLEHKGAVVPIGVGLGRGELVEIRLLATSPLLDRPLKELAPDRWRIAAVFRDDELIVPMGDTRLKADDRVLLVGDPTVLLTVAENLRKGTPSFPQPFGANIVTLEKGEQQASLLREAGGLAEICQPAKLIRGIPADQQRNTLGKRADDEDEQRASVSTFEIGAADGRGLRELLSGRGAGVVVTSPVGRSFLSNVLGRRGEDARLCDAAEVPVLFSRGTFPYKRILVPVSPSVLSMQAAMVAIDLTRRLGASLTTVNVDLPQYISGEPLEEAHWEVVPIRRLCELYEVPMEYRHHWGNPVRLLADEARHHDLVVMARRPSRSDSYLSPDVALWIARRVRCSVMVLTIAPRS